LYFDENIFTPINAKTMTVSDAIDSLTIGAPNHEPKLLDSGSIDNKIALKIACGQKLCDVRGGINSVHSWEIPEVYGVITSKEKKVLEIIQSLRRKERRRACGDSDPVLLQSVERETSFKAEPVINALVKKKYLRRIDEGVDLASAFNGWYRRLNPSGCSPTVDTRFGRPKYFLHPTENRGLTVREAARIQSFPDSFVFSGTEAEQYKMIGNAVPPQLAKSIATRILKAIDRSTVTK
jgi:DNA (cytosine-5)-methyltransferase 1